jgi:hypothetical protein
MHDNNSERSEASIGHDPRQMELPLQDGDGATDGDRLSEENTEGTEAERTRIDRGSFDVRQMEEHEDGSATFSIHAQPEDMQRLFEAFFHQALVLGIFAAKKEADDWMAGQKALALADKLVRFLDVWEVTECFDYSPSVEEVKKELKAALKNVRAYP